MEEARYSLLHHLFLGSLEGLEHCKHVGGKEVQLDEPGVKPQDKKGEVSQRRATELNAAKQRIRVADQRTWVALRRDYTVAEELASDGFQNTILFEPFAGSFITTRVAASR